MLQYGMLNKNQLIKNISKSKRKFPPFYYNKNINKNILLGIPKQDFLDLLGIKGIIYCF